MGTSPAPELLANDFAFWHEYGFLIHMVNECKQYGPGRYPFEFISQYAGSTKRYGTLMTSSRSLLAIRLDPRYKTLFYKMVSSLICTLLRFVSLMVAYGLLLSRLFMNK